MSTPDPTMPRDYGWRWFAWLCWTNKLSILFTAQSVFLYLTADADLPKAVTHYCLAAANILGLVLAQVSRKQGLPPPPTKAP